MTYNFELVTIFDNLLLFCHNMIYLIKGVIISAYFCGIVSDNPKCTFIFENAKRGKERDFCKKNS